MDRRTNSRLKLRVFCLSALALSGCGSPTASGPALSDSSAEPRRLGFLESAQSLRPIDSQAVTQTAYPFSTKNAAPLVSPVVQPGIPFSPTATVAAPDTKVPDNQTDGPELTTSQSPPSGGAIVAEDAAGSASLADGRLPPVTDNLPSESIERQNDPQIPGATAPPSYAAVNAPVAIAPGIASAAMVTVNRRAQLLATKGCSLAERGALFSARSLFIEALRTVAEARDMELSTDVHTRSLTDGLTALREVRDFKTKRTTLDPGIDLEYVTASHRTPVLKQSGCAGVTALAAQQRYLTYARQQFEIAAGRQPAASFALYGLGRIAALGAKQENVSALGDTGQAMVFYQASVATDARNFRATNELGVLLADTGNWAAARDLFAHSLSVSAQPVALQNLATAYDRLGQPALAAKARAHVPRGYGMTPELPLKWLDPVAFARTPSGPDGQVTTGQANAAGTPSQGYPQAATGTAAQPSTSKASRR